ncbi:MAG: hypothetical protein II819_11595 [Fibrobacter sp.]|nr:hypothetical protein [Fibrobacter sp.]MBQ6770472.1 hypothetical protein [Bacteroidales bacterium]
MLNKDALKNALKTIMQTEGNDADSAANALANAIDAYVKSAKVTVTAPIGAIAVQGSPTAQSNVAPISIEGELS